jgi:hypothetical protein
VLCQADLLEKETQAELDRAMSTMSQVHATKVKQQEAEIRKLHDSNASLHERLKLAHEVR